MIKIMQYAGAAWMAFLGLFVRNVVVQGPSSAAMPLPQTAIVAETMVQATATVTPVLAPGLLPSVTLGKAKTQAAKPTSAPTPKPSALPSPLPSPASTPAVTAGADVTAQSFLGATTLFTKETRSGPYEISFATTLADSATFVWDLSKATIGGSGAVPSFSVSYTCNPIPTMPLPGATDQNPTFNIRTSYICTVGLAAQSGIDQAEYQKQFSFNTGPGQFVVTPPSSMNTVLGNSENDGGFVFDNQDANPITVTGLTLDVSYTALNTGEGPLVLRFLDPVSGNSLGEYHLENLPLDPSAQSGPAAQFTRAQTGIQIPLSFTIPAASQKILPIELLGAHTMSIMGVNPTVSVTLTSITSNAPSDIKTVLGLAQIEWSCVVPQGSYDPNATSGAIYAGNACK